MKSVYYFLQHGAKALKKTWQVDHQYITTSTPRRHLGVPGALWDVHLSTLREIQDVVNDPKLAIYWLSEHVLKMR